MPTTLSLVFNNLQKPPSDRPGPMLNQLSQSLSSYLQAHTQTQRKKRLMQWYKAIPELTALINKVAHDIVCDIEFKAIDELPALRT